MKRFSLFLILSVWSLFSFNALADTRLEAEKAPYSNCTVVTDSKYSAGKALELTESSAKITFTYSATVRGKYTIYVGYDALYGEKMVNMSVNGSGSTFKVSGRTESAVGTYIMNKGKNTIIITPSWTWFRIDYIRIETSESSVEFNISETPIDANATDGAKALYTFLNENFGKKTISGMMTGDMGSANGNITQHDDIQAVYKVSGKYPALIGFDFLFATGSKENDAWNKTYTTNMIKLAMDTWKRGGLPAFTWHWRDPSRSTFEFYTDKSTVKISDALNADGSWNTSSTLYRYFIRDIDKIANYFLTLQRNGMACIFRPLHEGSGGWFWWGREGATNFIKLYRLIYDEMVNVKGVHNVIWVWNAAEDDQDWCPGDDYYDVVSLDIYNDDSDYSSNYVAFDKVKTNTEGKKIVALSENGPIPDIDKEFDEEAVWSWWMPWYQTWDGKFVDKTSAAEWKKCMNDERVITLEDLSAGWDVYAGISSSESTHNEADDAIYDLQGRRLREVPTKGIYIRGNKKILAR
ncbi:MAG: hypothetical protein K6C10_01805 [Prevotella sp.]|nr:hypothetical protein [Prevotella sp.]